MFEDLKKHCPTGRTRTHSGHISRDCSGARLRPQRSDLRHGSCGLLRLRPQSVILKSFVEQLSNEKGCHDEYQLYASVERLAKEVITQNRKIYKGVCANVDFYSGFVYDMLGIPMELYTPLFAVARQDAAAWKQEPARRRVCPQKIVGTIGEKRDTGDYSNIRMREEQPMIKIDARGDACPLPVVKAKKAIAELHGPGEVEVLVDNEIAVQNLTKMAQQKGYLSSSEKLAEQEYRVRFTIKDTPAAETAVPGKVKQQAEAETCIPDARTDTVVVIASDKDGGGGRGAGQDPCSRLSCSP